MNKVRDRITGGIIAGLAANTVKNVFELAMVRKGFSERSSIDVAAGVFLPSRNITSNSGRFAGFIADNTIASLLGISTSYMFTFTGKDKPYLKGAFMGNAAWCLAYGMLAKMGATTLRPRKTKTVLIAMATHTLFGLTSAFFLNKIMDSGLYKPHYNQLGTPGNGTAPPDIDKRKIQLLKKPSEQS